MSEEFCCRSHYPADTPIVLAAGTWAPRTRKHTPAPAPPPCPAIYPRWAAGFPIHPSIPGARQLRDGGAKPGPAQRAARVKSRPRTPRGTTRLLPVAFSSARAACARMMSVCRVTRHTSCLALLILIGCITTLRGLQKKNQGLSLPHGSECSCHPGRENRVMGSWSLYQTWA